MALDGSSVLQFLPRTESVISAEIKTAMFYNASHPLILPLELSHNAIKNKFQYDLP